jgi:hypothetical protein
LLAILLASSRSNNFAAESAPRLILEIIDVGEHLSAVIAQDKTCGLFLDSPRWREAACGSVTALTERSLYDHVVHQERRHTRAAFAAQTTAAVVWVALCIGEGGWCPPISI